MLTFRALQSGSAGNAFVVQTDEVALLLDAGLTVRRMRHYLQRFSVRPDLLGGIVLTHEHQDHAAGAAAIASDRGHLSNLQSAACLARCAERGRMRWGWLAHLSETNNSQKCALQTVNARLRGGALQVGCLRRRAPSLTWRSTDAYVQTRLF